MRVAIYARVSTKDKHQTTENQLLKLIPYCEVHGWEYSVYQEKVSTRNSNRPELRRLMEDVRKGLYSGVVVLRIDRFGRSVRDLLANITEIRSRGLFFEAIDQGIRALPQREPLTEFMLVILSGVAELERDFISERVRDDINRVKGEDPEKKVNGRKSLEERFPDRIPRIFELRDQNMSIRQISEQVGMKRSSVHRILSGKPPMKKTYPEYINPLLDEKQSSKEVFNGHQKDEGKQVLNSEDQKKRSK